MKKAGIYVYSLLLTLVVFAFDYPQQTREAKVSVDVDNNTRIKFKGSSIDLEIETWEKPQVVVTAQLQFQGKETSRMMDFIDNFQQVVEENVQYSGGSLFIDADLDEPNKVQIGGKNVGVQIGYNENDLKITYRINVPAGNELDIKNSYKDILIRGDLRGETTIEHYSGKLFAQSFNQLTLDMKYGETEIDNVERMDAKFYENDTEITRIGKGEIESKYSELRIRSLGEVNFEGYETKIKSMEASRLTGNFKYSQIEIQENVNEIDFTSIYETDTEVGTIDFYRIRESKYSKLYAEKVGIFDVTSSYEDKLEADQLGELNTSSKYGKYKIGRLHTSLRLMEAYESDTDIFSFSSSASLIDISGKYCKLNVFTEGVPFSVSGNIRYGKVNYPSNGMNRRVYIKDSDRLEVEAETSDYQDGNLSIRLSGYEVEADIR